MTKIADSIKVQCDFKDVTRPDGTRRLITWDKLFVGEDGILLDDIKSIHIKCDAGGIATASVEQYKTDEEGSVIFDGDEYALTETTEYFVVGAEVNITALRAKE